MLTLDPARSALLVMDYQREILARLGDAATPILERAAHLIAAARAAKVLVIYVVVGFRPGYPEISPHNAMFAGLTKSGGFSGLNPGETIHPAVRQQEGDVIVVKHRVSGFAGTDLDMILRARGLETLVLAGFATSGVVLSSLRHAADADYRLVVAEDACADADPEVHRVLMEKVFPRQATVVNAAEVVEALANR